MTQPHDTGFAGQLYDHAAENWQFYAAVAGGVAVATGIAVACTDISPEARHQLDLTRRFGEATPPHKVKPQEAPTFTTDAQGGQGDPTGRQFLDDEVKQAPVRLNEGYQDLTARQEQGESFTPQPDVKYLWVIGENGHLMTGVEVPRIDDQATPEQQAEQARQKHAFVDDPEHIGNTGQAQQANWNAVQDLGHPTLAATFDANGDAHVGAGRIGGELFQENNVWVINDHSGRYGRNRGDSTHLLANAAEEFRNHGVDVQQIRVKAQNDRPIDVNTLGPQPMTIGNAVAEVSARVSALAGNVASLVSGNQHNGPGVQAPPAQQAGPNIPPPPPRQGGCQIM